MPDPVSYSYNVVKPFAYETSTPPVHQKAYTNSTHNFGSNTSSGASIGSAFGPYGAFLGSAVGLGTDIWQAIYAKRRAAEANEESRKAAAQASARSSAEARAARNWNSEQQQIRRLRMAGLSPGLAYGQMSPSTAVAAPQEKADVHKADTPKFDNESILRALELLVKQQQADTALAAQQSTSALQGSQIGLNQIDQIYRGVEYQAKISGILADKDLSDAKKIEILSLLTNRKENLDANTNVANANARLANANASVTEEYGDDLALSEIAKNGALTKLSKQQAREISWNLGLTQQNYEQIVRELAANGFDDSYAPVVLYFVENLAKSSGSMANGVINNATNLISGFFDLSNWKEIIQLYVENRVSSSGSSEERISYDKDGNVIGRTTTTRSGHSSSSVKGKRKR